MVGIFPPTNELLQQRADISAAANAPTRAEAIDRLVQQYGYGRGDAATIVDAMRIAPVDGDSTG